MQKYKVFSSNYMEEDPWRSTSNVLNYYVYNYDEEEHRFQSKSKLPKIKGWSCFSYSSFAERGIGFMTGVR